MVIKQETICDSCNKRVADRKCTLCQNDLCSSCSRHSFELIMRGDSTHIIGNIAFCKNCNERLKKELGEELFDEDFKKEMSNQFGVHLVKRIMVEKL